MNVNNPNQLLVIDSNETKCKMLARQLEQLDYMVTTAKDGGQALAMLASGKAGGTQPQKFNLVLLGVEVPEEDIHQLLEQIKADPTLGSIPVIVVSTADEVDRVAKYLESGADDFWLETHNLVLLKTRIEACLMKASLEDRSQAHSGMSAKLEHDMEVGHQIQNDFLPNRDTLPQPSGWDIAARFYPARQVAGDFFDVIPLIRGKLGLVIADVCDKGVGPAIFMALARSLIRAFAEQHRPLGWMDSITEDQPKTGSKKRGQRQRLLMSSGASSLLAVELTNNYIVNNHGNMNMFATLFFGVLDPTTGVLTYVNGGHDAPAIVGSDSVVKTRLKPTGPAVGILPNANFGIAQVTLDPGDLLMTFTDGAFDARNPAGERFTIERLLALLKQPDPSVSALLDRIVATLREHIADADQFDDITMLAARRKL